MNKVVVTGEVFFFNGIYLTKDAIEAIDSLQTGGTVGWDEKDWPDRNFTNEVLNGKIKTIDEMVNQFIFLAQSEFIEKSEAWKFINWLTDIRFYLSELAAPPKLAQTA